MGKQFAWVVNCLHNFCSPYNNAHGHQPINKRLPIKKRNSIFIWTGCFWQLILWYRQVVGHEHRIFLLMNIHNSYPLQKSLSLDTYIVYKGNKTAVRLNTAHGWQHSTKYFWDQTSDSIPNMDRMFLPIYLYVPLVIPRPHHGNFRNRTDRFSQYTAHLIN